jgi:hypothetical protein
MLGSWTELMLKSKIEVILLLFLEDEEKSRVALMPKLNKLT